MSWVVGERPPGPELRELLHEDRVVGHDHRERRTEDPVAEDDLEHQEPLGELPGRDREGHADEAGRGAVGWSSAQERRLLDGGGNVAAALAESNAEVRDRSSSEVVDHVERDAAQVGAVADDAAVGAEEDGSSRGAVGRGNDVAVLDADSGASGALDDTGAVEEVPVGERFCEGARGEGGSQLGRVAEGVDAAGDEHVDDDVGAALLEVGVAGGAVLRDHPQPVAQVGGQVRGGAVEHLEAEADELVGGRRVDGRHGAPGGGRARPGAHPRGR